MTGQCSSFNDVRGFGFVSVPDIVNESKRYFVHHSAIQRHCLVTGRVFANLKQLRASLRNTPGTGGYNPAKSRLHTGEYVRFTVGAEESTLGKSARVDSVFPITDGGTLMCEHIDMLRPPRYVRYIRRSILPEILSAAPEKVSIAQVALKKRNVPATGGIIEDQDWGDITHDIP